MQDKRDIILAAAFAVLAEDGYPGLTQPRVARRAGVRQGHLTYYFPTRRDLIEAVMRAAIERQKQAVDAMLAEPGSAADRIGRIVARKDTTRVLVALVQGADQDPALSALFGELVEGMRHRIRALLPAARAGTGAVQLLHALSVGLAVLGLAAEDAQPRATATLGLAFRLLAAMPAEAIPAKPNRRSRK